VSVVLGGSGVAYQTRPLNKWKCGTKLLVAEVIN